LIPKRCLFLLTKIEDNSFSKKEGMMYIVAQVQSPWSKMMGDGDHPQALSRVKAAQGPNQEMAFSLALLVLSQPGLSKKWSDFLTLVS